MPSPEDSRSSGDVWRRVHRGCPGVAAVAAQDNTINVNLRRGVEGGAYATLPLAKIVAAHAVRKKQLAHAFKKELAAFAVRKIVGQDRCMTHSFRIYQVLFEEGGEFCRVRSEVYRRLRALHKQAAKMSAIINVSAAEMACD